jgi:hypothetical protein
MKALIAMNIHNAKTARKAVRTARPIPAETNIHAVRWILDRYDVSPSLARTIAALASLWVR